MGALSQGLTALLTMPICVHPATLASFMAMDAAPKSTASAQMAHLPLIALQSDKSSATAATPGSSWKIKNVKPPTYHSNM
jgi:hypothetical protein